MTSGKTWSYTNAEVATNEAHFSPLSRGNAVLIFWMELKIYAFFPLLFWLALKWAAVGRSRLCSPPRSSSSQVQHKPMYRSESGVAEMLKVWLLGGVEKVCQSTSKFHVSGNAPAAVQCCVSTELILKLPALLHRKFWVFSSFIIPTIINTRHLFECISKVHRSICWIQNLWFFQRSTRKWRLLIPWEIRHLHFRG